MQSCSAGSAGFGGSDGSSLAWDILRQDGQEGQLCFGLSKNQSPSLFEKEGELIMLISAL